MNTHLELATPTQPAEQPENYNAPEFIEYGPIEVLTQAGSGDDTDTLGGSGPV